MWTCKEIPHLHTQISTSLTIGLSFLLLIIFAKISSNKTNVSIFFFDCIYQNFDTHHSHHSNIQ